MSNKPAATLELVKEPKMPRPLHERLLSIPKLAERCPGFGEGQIRNWLRLSKSNGLADSGAIIRPHENRIYIDTDAFDRWLESRMAER